MLGPVVPPNVFLLSPAGITFVRLRREGRPGIEIVGLGSGPHFSFADAPPFNSPRWGDYSWAAPDPQSGQIWMATEYIPPTSEWDGFDNWGTYIFAVNG